MTTKANTTYLPRHAAKPLPLVERVKRSIKRVDRWLDKDLSGPGLTLCGILMGLILWPVVLYCYFG